MSHFTNYLICKLISTMEPLLYWQYGTYSVHPVPLSVFQELIACHNAVVTNSLKCSQLVLCC